MRMYPRNPKTLERKKVDDLGTDQRDIKITCHRPVGVERFSLLEVMTGYRTAAQNGHSICRSVTFKHAAKFLEPFAIAVERKPDRILALFFVRQLCVGFPLLVKIYHSFVILV